MTAHAEVAIVDSGGANLASLAHALDRLGARARITSDASEIRAATRVLVPGVGSAQSAMRRLAEAGLDTLIPALTQPVLGICLGMQLLFRHSAEGDTRCLGIIDDDVVRLAPAAGLPVPHMGWNSLVARRDDPLLDGVGETDWFYFVHSFAARPGPATLAGTEYGGQIAAVVRQRNFWGVQFHPERSSGAGAKLLANFLRLG